jgi:Rod binding domain-containing protein
MSPSFSDVHSVSIDPYNSKANQMLHKTETPKQQDDKIDKSAKDFESLLLTSWLQQAQQSFASVPGGDAEADAEPGKEQMQGFAMQSLGTALTASGGLGIADSIAKLLHKSSDKPAPTAQQPLPALGLAR